MTFQTEVDGSCVCWVRYGSWRRVALRGLPAQSAAVRGETPVNLQDIFQLRLVEHPFIFKGPKKCNLPNYY